MDVDVKSMASNYNDLKQNVLSLLALLSKFVKVHLIKQKTLSGFIHSIDPLSHSIILLVPHEEQSTYQGVIIPGHAVLEVIEDIPNSDVEVPSNLFINTQDTHSSIRNALERKEKLLSWFRLNYLPVSESGENIIFGDVIILPPYTVTDICTDNPIVAMQVTKVMKDMPEDFKPVTSDNIKEESQ